VRVPGVRSRAPDEGVHREEHRRWVHRFGHALPGHRDMAGLQRDHRHVPPPPEADRGGPVFTSFAPLLEVFEEDDPGNFNFEISSFGS